MNLDNLNHTIRTDEHSDGSFYELILTRTHGITRIEFNDHDFYEADVWSEEVIGTVNVLKYISNKIKYYYTECYRTDVVWLYEDMLEHVLFTLFSEEKINMLMEKYHCKFYLDLVEAIV